LPQPSGSSTAFSILCLQRKMESRNRAVKPTICREKRNEVLTRQHHRFCCAFVRTEATQRPHMAKQSTIFKYEESPKTKDIERVHKCFGCMQDASGREDMQQKTMSFGIFRKTWERKKVSPREGFTSTRDPSPHALHNLIIAEIYSEAQSRCRRHRLLPRLFFLIC